MFVQPKCPKCDHESDLFDLKRVTIGDKLAGPFFNGVAACCKKCHSVLGITIDPSHTISAIKAEFPGRNVAGTHRKPNLT
jgi:hypothetical protein